MSPQAFTLLTLFASTEERVRVLVAVAPAEGAAAKQVEARERVIGSLSTTRVERWGKTPVFEPEVTREELAALRRSRRP